MKGDGAGPQGEGAHGRLYAWAVFALTLGLMLSDYVSRQVITPVFPFLKHEWSLSDTQLGGLVSVVALIVGVCSLPVALLADRWGRVKSITAMAGLWGLATIACGLSRNYSQMMVSRALVGLGEAGYGSAGGAILVHVFPKKRHAMIMGAFLAASLFGTVGGVIAGGVVSTHFGWRHAFIGAGAAGLLLVALYPFVVRDYRTVALVKPATGGSTPRNMTVGETVRELFAARTAIFTYLASGCQMFIFGAISAWMPSYMSRYYGLAPDQAAMQAALVVLVAGIGMIACGWSVDRLGQRDLRNKLRVPALYALTACVLLMVAFALPPGPVQFAVILAGVFVAGGHTGAAGAVVTDVTHPGLRATAFAVLVLGNNLLGLAPGPVIVGALSDAWGLKVALGAAPLMCLVASAFFLLASRNYRRDSGRFQEPADVAPAAATGPEK
jgi:MFS family permease